MKKMSLLVLVLCLCLTGCCPDRTVRTDISRYASDCASVMNAGDFMPKLKDLGEYDRIEYTYQKTCYSRVLQYYSEGMALFVQYAPTVYPIKKDNAQKAYSFLELPVVDREGNYCLPLTEFSYRGYQIRVIPDQEYEELGASRSFAMVGVNDETCTVVYLYCCDADIDYIAMKHDQLEKAMQTYLQNVFSWVEF